MKPAGLWGCHAKTKAETATEVTDDRQLLYELCRLGEALTPFNAGILTNTLSVTEQLDFGYRLIRVAGLIRGRVENQPPDTDVNGLAP